MDRLDDFVVDEILQSDAAAKYAVVLGRIDEKPCLIKVSRLALPEFSEAKGKNLPFRFPLNKIDSNDVYSWGTTALEEPSSVYLDVIWPATETHIAKYRALPTHVVKETPRDYATHVVPYIKTMQGERLAWVRGILDDGVEADRVLYRDEHFVLLPNSKWDGKTVGSLYLLVLVMRRDLASVRDLTAAEIPLIEHIRDKTAETVRDKFGLAASQLKMYFHYQPSYYHLHIHVANVELQQHDFGRSMLVDNVIDMLSVRPLGQATMSYLMSEGHALWPAFANKQS